MWLNDVFISADAAVPTVLNVRTLLDLGIPDRSGMWLVGSDRIVVRFCSMDRAEVWAATPSRRSCRLLWLSETARLTSSLVVALRRLVGCTGAPVVYDLSPSVSLVVRLSAQTRDAMHPRQKLTPEAESRSHGCIAGHKPRLAGE